MSEQLANDFDKILRKELVLSYMEVALKHVRECAVFTNTRKDVLEFLKSVKNIPEEAIVVLTSNSISLLTTDEGIPLQFA
jgi:hypothetical protein